MSSIYFISEDISQSENFLPTIYSSEASFLMTSLKEDSYKRDIHVWKLFQEHPSKYN